MKKKVFVAMSGGVDSSVSATILKKRGYNVVGTYFKTYKPDGDKEYCRRQGNDAKKVCEQLGIPFRVFDLQEEYKKYVFEYMIKEYEKGNTPNPDIMCNKYIKFGFFAEKAFSCGATHIATGHYARILNGPPIKLPFFKNCAEVRLLRSVDKNKDQSYFLSQLSQSQLKNVIFPIGGLTKTTVRKIAKKYKLHTAEKKDSQGICFVGQKMKIKDFLKKYVKTSPGEVLNSYGDIVGEHEGCALYTVGERHNFKIYSKYQTPNMPKMFVLRKDISKNTITVGTREELDKRKVDSLTISDCNWIASSPKENKKYICQIRHRGEKYECKLQKSEDENGEEKSKWIINFYKSPYAPAVGQFVAIYDKDICLGGGVIHRAQIRTIS